MAKRQLTRRQSWRIQKVQDERLARAERKRQRLATTDEPIGAEQTGRVIANYGASLDIEDADGHIHRCHLRQNLSMPVVGDEAIWCPVAEGGGVVVAVAPRCNELARPDSTGAMKAIAANIDTLFVVAAPRPTYNTDTIDPFLIAAAANQIPAALVFNKVDLLDAAGLAAAERDLDRYRAIGYPVLHASTHTLHGLDELAGALAGQTGIFVGQSGVGKSSLVRALAGDDTIAVGALTEQTGLGRHTTSAARLYHLPTGGTIIDSPGVREFRLWPMTPRELAEGFLEFRPHLGHCRFRDCRHDGEPGCALAAAVGSGEIARERLESYHRLTRVQAELEPGY